MNKPFYDIFISGAGIVGATLALRLAQKGFYIMIIDNGPVPVIISKKNIRPELRVSAINHFSVKLLNNIHIWEKIDSYLYVPFWKLEIWECPSSMVTFNSYSLNLSNMGYIIENQRLKFALLNSFSNYINKIVFDYPCSLDSMYYNGEYWELKLNNDQLVNCRLLIGADGTESIVRKKSNINVVNWKYHQSCMVFSIKFTKNQYGTIWQVFTPSGPKGFLPLYNNWGLLMWYDTEDHITELKKLSLYDLEKKIQNNFSDKLGFIKLFDYKCFSLLHQHALTYVKDGLALVGDSAHTINPLAGQGVNLGLRDVDMLVNILTSAKEQNELWYTLKILKRYQKYRRCDNYCMQTGINCLYAIFSNDILCLKIIRNLALIFVERFPYLKNNILKYALGLNFYNN